MSPRGSLGVGAGAGGRELDLLLHFSVNLKVLNSHVSFVYRKVLSLSTRRRPGDAPPGPQEADSVSGPGFVVCGWKAGPQHFTGDTQSLVSGVSCECARDSRVPPTNRTLSRPQPAGQGKDGSNALPPSSCTPAFPSRTPFVRICIVLPSRRIFWPTTSPCTELHA